MNAPVSTQVTALTIVGALALLSACRSHPDQTSHPTIRVAGTVWDDFEADVSSGGLSIQGETEYTSIEAGGGITLMEPTSDGGERKVSRAELSLAAAEFVDLDAIEFTGGGRWFFGSNSVFQPFAAVHAVGTFFDDISGIEVGSQLGVRAGGGVEVMLTDSLFIDLTVDYTFPIVAAESDTNPTVETEVDGVAARIGLGFIF